MTKRKFLISATSLTCHIATTPSIIKHKYLPCKLGLDLSNTEQDFDVISLLFLKEKNSAAAGQLLGPLKSPYHHFLMSPMMLIIIIIKPCKVPLG